MVIQENRLEFSFREGVQAVKYDDTDFYRKKYQILPGSKGVDILAVSPSAFWIIEVKDCSDTAQNQDKWRRSYEGMESLSEEIALKVIHTCAALAGAHTFGDRCAAAAELQPAAAALSGAKIPRVEQKLLVILFLEGDFACYSRSNKTIYRDIKQRIERKLEWLNCRVDVVSTDTYKSLDYSVRLLPSR